MCKVPDNCDYGLCLITRAKCPDKKGNIIERVCHMKWLEHSGHGALPRKRAWVAHAKFGESLTCADGWLPVVFHPATSFLVLLL